MPFFMRSLLMLTLFFIFFCPHIEAEERIKISDSTPLSLVPPTEIYYRNVELNGKPYCLASLNKNRKSSELENVNYWTLKVNETKSIDPYVTHIKRGNFQLATTKWMRTFTHDVKLVHVIGDDKKSYHLEFQVGHRNKEAKDAVDKSISTLTYAGKDLLLKE